MTRVTFDSKALKKVRDIYSKRANEVAKILLLLCIILKLQQRIEKLLIV